LLRAETVHQEATFRLVVSENLLVAVWSEAPELDQMHAFVRALRAVIGKHGRRTGSINLILAGTPRFTDDVRAEAVRLMRDPRLQSSCTAHIVLVGGLAGAAARAFMSTVLLLGRPATPSRVFSETRTAAMWLAPLLSQGGGAWSVVELIELLASIEVAARAGTAFAGA
jgi:hypothetical protein